MATMKVKGRVVIEVTETGQISVVPEAALSRLEVNAAVLEAWRLVIVGRDLGWYRAIKLQEELAEGPDLPDLPDRDPAP
jgi:hypothetical protein